MTRDERRAQCIKAMVARTFIEVEHPYTITRDGWVDIMNRAFDSLNGIVRVNSIEPTEEMIAIGQEAIAEEKSISYVWRAMSATADLTNPPEKKP